MTTADLSLRFDPIYEPIARRFHKNPKAFADAFARADFSFDTYGARLKRHPLFVQLSVRTWLARFVYRINNPMVVRIGWRVMQLLVRLTPWRRRDYVPGRRPEFRLTDTASQH